MTELMAVAAVGDVLDRLTILGIKAGRLRDPVKRAHVEHERARLLEAWCQGGLPEPASVAEFDALIAVNTALWDVEDALRADEAAGDFGPAFVERARSVYRLNDQRAALKRAINQRFGSAIQEEKQHPAYASTASDTTVATPSPTPTPPREGGSLTHVDPAGNARMVEVGDKPVTRRAATAEGYVRMGPDALAILVAGRARKGDVLGVAQIAGILAAKRTGELIPLCHPLPLDGVDLTLDPVEDGVHIRATTRCTGRTGVEMEALTAVSVAALTVYDMLKAVDRGMRVEGVRLLAKSGGRSGDWRA